MSSLISSKRWSKWRWVVGLVLLGLTVFLWTASNFLASTIFADNTYSKPYFVTYVNTSFFIIPLITILIQKACRYPENVRQWWKQIKERRQYVPLSPSEDLGYNSSPRSERQHSETLSQELLLGRPLDDGNKMAPSLPTVAALPPLTITEIAKLSLEFCILWYLANYFVAACLEYTTVSSSTILTSTCSVFTLLFGALFGVERFTLRKLLAVIASLIGIVMISGIDFSGKSTDDEHRGDFPQKTFRDLIIGDALALVSAVMYGLYAVFMKKRIGDESRISMPVFFGLVGFFNVIFLWPGFIILHYAGIERFELPPTTRVTAIILTNSVASLVSDLAWAYAVLLTSPIVVTVGLSMTIPLSLIGQIVINSQTTSPLYWLGAAIVVLSFIFVNREEKRDENVVSVPIEEIEPADSVNAPAGFA
ncbi:MAG: hypothetical protein FE78DRAFT_141890 [Acidomyces sp. 'richmondensis']|nr:MAG: hypothetical protein FE78DRAFT_141890 [Acidomyces sp. 'richmondensis']